ncbi:MAG TPA: tRNA (adenosine(37)-N6)-threonylcarbamoyltransferase complex dimerization subunit type 1 TsaB [Candidatus Limnocylindrales bacterium]|nr:tRNA (adenosine(37)-N6)-threonylcarbamoyltransferase complex dimerization subunit type 1 TsaB [Candidatus Limnocylindrales bacterium]
MILVIDTSSPVQSVVGTIDGADVRQFTSPRLDRELLQDLVRSGPVTKVAVATGPGSFTGLRVGVSFGLGLAIGLRIPIVPLPTLDLQAARSSDPVTAVVEAGRGRYYFRVPGGAARLGAPADIPASHDLVGSVADPAALLAAGHHLKPESELRPLVEAAGILLETAREVPYRSLEIEYMQSFSPSR